MPTDSLTTDAPPGSLHPVVRRLFDKQIKLQNPLWWIGCGIIIAYRKILRLIPRKPQHNHCENCGCDVGASLWGWCSVPCLKALAAKSLNGELSGGGDRLKGSNAKE